MSITVNITGATRIVAPVRRTSDVLGFSLDAKLVLPTLEALLQEAKTAGTAVLAVEQAKANHAWVQHDDDASSYSGTSSGTSYVHDSHVGRIGGPEVVLSMVSDGLGKVGASRHFRVSVTQEAAEALLLVGTHYPIVTVFVMNNTLQITGGE